MEKYKIDIYNTSDLFDPPAFLETKIPQLLVDKVRESLSNLHPNLIPCPIIVDPNNLNLIIGIIEIENEKASKKYNITISHE